MPRHHLLALATIAMTASTYAADGEGHYLIWGHGHSSCNSYNQARGGDDKTYKQYIAGYITAYNTFVPETYSITPAMDMDAITAWLDDYCADKETTGLADALRHLAEEMLDKREKTSPAGGARWP